jgi:hypothetical protein
MAVSGVAVATAVLISQTEDSKEVQSPSPVDADGRHVAKMQRGPRVMPLGSSVRTS